jgi:EpsI family protein
MNPDTLKASLASLLMLAASAGAVVMRPTKMLAEELGRVQLESMIPTEVGEWRLDTSVSPVAVAPDVRERIDRIYNQTLGRTYVDNQGQRVMLSVAYGGDQSDGLRAHRPEVCYAAQGFQVFGLKKDTLSALSMRVPVMRLMAKTGQRNEPITYWMTVGNVVVTTSLQQKLAQLRYGFLGKIPDGMLVRISSIDEDSTHAFLIQDRFISQLLSNAPEESRLRLIGRL